jgi:hypothetical protein
MLRNRLLAPKFLEGAAISNAGLFCAKSTTLPVFNSTLLAYYYTLSKIFFAYMSPNLPDPAKVQREKKFEAICISLRPICSCAPAILNQSTTLIQHFRTACAPFDRQPALGALDSRPRVASRSPPKTHDDASSAEYPASPINFSSNLPHAQLHSSFQLVPLHPCLIEGIHEDLCLSFVPAFRISSFRTQTSDHQSCGVRLGLDDGNSIHPLYRCDKRDLV